MSKWTRGMRMGAGVVVAAAGLLWPTGMATARVGEVVNRRDDERTLLHYAPATSTVVIGTDRFADLAGAAEKTTWGEMVGSEEVTAFLARPTDKFFETINQWRVAPLGRKEWQWPVGVAGLAVFPTPEGEGEEAASAMDTSFLVVVDFGNEDFVRDMLAAGAWKRGKLESGVTVETSESEGHEVITIKGPPVDREAILAKVREWWPNIDEEGIAQLEEDGYFDQKTPDIHVGWAGGVVMACSHRGTLDGILRWVDGEARESLADNHGVHTAFEAVGGQGQTYGIIRVREMLPSADTANAGDDEMAAMAAEQAKMMERATGLGAIESVVMRGDFAGSGTILQVSAAAVMPDGPSGMITLLGETDEAFVPPAWVDADTAGYARIMVKFDRIVPLIRETIGMLPEEERAQASDMFESTAAGMLEVVTEQLGPTIHFVEWPMGPDATPVDGKPTVFAITCRDGTVIQNAIVPYIGPLGLEARDFAGFRMFDSEAAGMSLGFGKECVFIGPKEYVERILRSDAGASGLTADPGYAAAAKELPQKTVMAQFMASRPMVEQIRSLAVMLADEEGGGDGLGGMNPVMMPFEMMRGMLSEWLDAKTVPTVEQILKYVGPGSGSLHFSDDGLVCTVKWLEPVGGK